MSPDVLADLPLQPAPETLSAPPVIETRGLNLYYGNFHALKDVTIPIPPRTITAFIGPSGCGKSTLLRTFNRMNDLIRGVRITGEVLLDSQTILGPGIDLISLRKRVGMVFQRPNPFPISIFENVAYGPRVHHFKTQQRLPEIVEQSLRATGLWKEVKDKLNEPALTLPPEQQQRLCISRLLAVKPDVLLMDEPCSALDPIATQRIEEMILGLKEQYSIVIVTHNMQQAARVSAMTAYFYLGELVEFGPTGRIFTSPQETRTEQYITGRFG
ncbi:MAG: phosphate ABC transporter ATP-binding protein [Elusimicrobia bacterium]|jgi:phosphate transport system ATP-binding protein|nr:phosphate ABC transporter ATP-binding protein [Elusimicrobiota bacterium]